MTTHDVAFVGTGVDPTDPDENGFAMAYHHATAFDALDNCRLHACADLVPERAAAFAESVGIPSEHVYDDAETLLASAQPSIVSICVPPAAHADLVVAAAETESVRAIHCEKPMALTWGGARRMARVCRREGVQLTFNHQRRFKPAWVAARERIEDGAIGDLTRVESTPPNLYDWGTHAIDFANAVVGDVPATWVIGAVDYREEQRFFGAHNENQALGSWEYENGVMGVVSTGEGAALTPALIRFVGTEGVLDVEPDDPDADYRWRTDGEVDWNRRTFEDGHWTDAIDDAIAHVVDCLESGAESELSAQKALHATEIIFGVWESARRRGRVEFPLEIDDNPLHAMVDAGDLTPEPTED